MKRSIVIMALMLICFGIKAIAAGPDVCYVKTANKVYFGQGVKMGILNTKIISSDGTITKVKTLDVTSYMNDGRQYDLLPLICPSGDTLCRTFMEYMTSRSGLKLYRYKCCESFGVEYGYFVYKDNKLYLRVDQYNADAILPFFGVKNVIVI